MATRCHTPKSLQTSNWFTGPAFLWQEPGENTSTPPPNPVNLPEMEQNLSTFRTSLQKSGCFLELSTRLSKRSRQVNVILRLLQQCRKWMAQARSRLHHSDTSKDSAKLRHMATQLLLKDAQLSCYSDILVHIRHDNFLPIYHPLARLCPVLGPYGLL